MSSVEEHMKNILRAEEDSLKKKKKIVSFDDVADEEKEFTVKKIIDEINYRKIKEFQQLENEVEREYTEYNQLANEVENGEENVKNAQDYFTKTRDAEMAIESDVNELKRHLEEECEKLKMQKEKLNERKKLLNIKIQKLNIENENIFKQKEINAIILKRIDVAEEEDERRRLHAVQRSQGVSHSTPVEPFDISKYLPAEEQE
jgi:hypothetical protein